MAELRRQVCNNLRATRWPFVQNIRDESMQVGNKCVYAICFLP
jgi:hypothetical protein